MRKKILFILLFSCYLCACRRNIDDKHKEFVKNTTIFEEITIDENSSVEIFATETPTEQTIIEGLNLLQRAMLNMTPIYSYNEFGRINEPIYFNELHYGIVENCQSFVVEDFDHDGQSDVGLYYAGESLKSQKGFIYLFIYNNLVFYCYGSGREVYDDGYFGTTSQSTFSRYEMEMSKYGYISREVIKIKYDQEGNIIYGQSDLEYIGEFSSIPATRHELTQKNIMKYVK